MPTRCADRRRNWQLAPDVSGGLGLERLLKVTRAVPIVFAIVPDPLGSGFVESLSQSASRLS